MLTADRKVLVHVSGTVVQQGGFGAADSGVAVMYATTTCGLRRSEAPYACSLLREVASI